MKIEQELQTSRFRNETQKAQLNILFTASWIRTRLADSLKPHNLTLEQFNVMRIIRGHGEGFMLIKDITNRMLEPNSNTTRIIDRLEAKGLVKREIPHYDRRERQVSLTPAGLERLAAIDQSWENDDPHTAPWTTDEAQLVNKLLDKMRS